MPARTRECPDGTNPGVVLRSPNQGHPAVLGQGDALSEAALARLVQARELGLLGPGAMTVNRPDCSLTFVVARPADERGLSIAGQSDAGSGARVADLPSREKFGLLDVWAAGRGIRGQ